MRDRIRQRLEKRTAYLQEVIERRARVAGRQDYNFEQDLAPNERGTYPGNAKIEKWKLQCFDERRFERLVNEVDELTVRAAREERDERRDERKGLPQTPAQIRAEVAALQAARASAGNDEPPPLPNFTEEATAAAARPIVPLLRDELTLFGSTRKVRQVVPLKRKEQDNDDSNGDT
jgi:hypothetical protein